MLLLSTGLTCGVIFSNDAMLTMGTSTSVPDSSTGLTRAIRSSTAMIDAYSDPCEPATTASTGPEREPPIGSASLSGERGRTRRVTLQPFAAVNIVGGLGRRSAGGAKAAWTA